jgi:methionyl-tRNA formyltransferase
MPDAWGDRIMGVAVLDTIILLTGALEQPVLAQALRKENPQLTVRAVDTADELAALAPEDLARARLIAFATPVVVPGRVLDALGYGAYNFHPGPPEFPGWAASQFALYNGAREFGATAHRMVERVDAGPIVAVERFAITPRMDVGELEKLTYVHLAKIFWRLLGPLARQSGPLAELTQRWSGRKGTRRDYAALCVIPPDISKDELERRVRAFGGKSFGVNLAIELHGFRFELVAQEAPALPAQMDAIHPATTSTRQHHAA